MGSAPSPTAPAAALTGASSDLFSMPQMPATQHLFQWAARHQRHRRLALTGASSTCSPMPRCRQHTQHLFQWATLRHQRHWRLSAHRSPSDLFSCLRCRQLTYHLFQWAPLRHQRHWRQRSQVRPRLVLHASDAGSTRNISSNGLRSSNGTGGLALTGAPSDLFSHASDAGSSPSSLPMGYAPSPTALAAYRCVLDLFSHASDAGSSHHLFQWATLRHQRHRRLALTGASSDLFSHASDAGSTRNISSNGLRSVTNGTGG